MSGRLKYIFLGKTEYLLGHAHILPSYLMSTTMYMYCEILDLIVISIYKNLRTIVKIWKILICGARSCVVVCMVSYAWIRVIYVCTFSGFVLCFTRLFNRCKKWQHTCFCCSNNLWLLQGTRWHLWPALSLQQKTLPEHLSSPPIFREFALPDF